VSGGRHRSLLFVTGGRPVDPATGRRHEGIGRRNDRGQEPLELYARRAPGAHRRRAHGHRVHAVPRRRPRQLHGGGHIRGVPHEAGRGPCRGAGEVRRAIVHTAADRHRQPVAVRRHIPGRPHEGRDAAAHRPRWLRRGPRRTYGFGVRLARGHRAGATTSVRHPVADDQPPRGLVPGTRPEPGRRVPFVGRPRGAPHVHPAVQQRCTAGVQCVRRPVHGVVVEARRPDKTLRCPGARPPVRGVRQQPLRHRSIQACTAELHTRRRTAFGKAKELAYRT